MNTTPVTHTAPVTTMVSKHLQAPPATLNQTQPNAKSKTTPPAKGGAGTEEKSSSASSNKSAKVRKASDLVPVSNLSPLTPDDLRHLEELEAVVSAGLKAGNEAVELRNAAMTSRAAAVKAGNAAARALYEIKTYRDGVLWRKYFKRFVDYCAAKWGVKKSHAYRLTETGSFIAELEDKFSPTGENPAVPEYHFRQFCAVVPENYRLDCWQEITAGKDPAELTAAKMVSAAKGYLQDHGLEAVPKKTPKQPMDNSKARAVAMGFLEKLRTAVAGFPRKEKLDRAFSEIGALIEQAAGAPAIEVEATATDAGDVVADGLPEEEVVAPENDDATDEEMAPEVPAVDLTDRAEPSLTHEPSLPPSHNPSAPHYQPLSDEPVTIVRQPAGINKEQDRPCMNARKFHRVVLPAGTDFDVWLDVTSAKYPGDFGPSDDGEHQTITLLRARDIAHKTTGDLCSEALKIIQEIVASGVANPGEVANASFDDLANGCYVGGESRKRETARFGEGGSEA